MAWRTAVRVEDRPRGTWDTGMRERHRAPTDLRVRRRWTDACGPSLLLKMVPSSPHLLLRDSEWHDHCGHKSPSSHFPGFSTSLLPSVSQSVCLSVCQTLCRAVRSSGSPFCLLSRARSSERKGALPAAHARARPLFGSDPVPQRDYGLEDECGGGPGLGGQWCPRWKSRRRAS